MGIIEQLAEIKTEEGVEKATRLFVENLLANTDFTAEKIAFLAGVSVDFVKIIKEHLDPQ